MILQKEMRNSRGQFVKGLTPHNKGKGMSIEEKAKSRKTTLERYNNKPERKQAVSQWHSIHADKVKAIKQKYANSERGRESRKACGQRRIERVNQLEYTINWKYFWWMCQRLNFTCLGCGRVCTKSTITLDHQIPINRGGDNQEWNLAPLCKSCNSRKQDRLLFVDNILADLVYGEWLYANLH